jgi:arginine decarboxylase
MRLDANRAPLYEALERHAVRRAAAFHVPGHKGRATWDKTDAVRRYAELLPIDLTELSDTDDLHHPEGVIADAETLAADCFGAEETRFLVGGSTAGNLAMILGVCRPGELMLVQRNVHKSVVHGLMLAGARVVFLPPAVDPASGLAVVPAAETVREALRRYPEAKALLLSNPNYYGMASDLRDSIREAHERRIPVLVDEAHGPHFGRHPAFPASALQMGADVVVQSAHKMLSAMTMGAMLHLQGQLVSKSAVRQYLRMVQSSSPSYPIMASLDLARRELHTKKERSFEQALRTAEETRAGLEGTPFKALAADTTRGSYAIDPLKLVLFDATGTLDGFSLRDELERLGCIAEMADDRYVVLAFGTGTRPDDGQSLLAALKHIARTHRLEDRPAAGRREEASFFALAKELPEPVILHGEADDTEAVELGQAEGRAAGEWVIPYPPGIPVLYPGEIVTPSIRKQLERWRKQGARIQGASDTTLRTLKVLKR